MAIKNHAQIPTTCGSCAKFPLKDALDAGGHAICQIYRKAKGYDWPATPLHMPAHDLGDRRRMIEIFEAQQRKGEDGKQTDAR